MRYKVTRLEVADVLDYKGLEGADVLDYKGRQGAVVSHGRLHTARPELSRIQHTGPSTTRLDSTPVRSPLTLCALNHPRA